MARHSQLRHPSLVPRSWLAEQSVRSSWRSKRGGRFLRASDEEKPEDLMFICVARCVKPPSPPALPLWFVSALATTTVELWESSWSMSVQIEEWARDEEDIVNSHPNPHHHLTGDVRADHLMVWKCQHGLTWTRTAHLRLGSTWGRLHALDMTVMVLLGRVDGTNHHRLWITPLPTRVCVMEPFSVSCLIFFFFLIVSMHLNWLLMHAHPQLISSPLQPCSAL